MAAVLVRVARLDGLVNYMFIRVFIVDITRKERLTTCILSV